MMMDPPPPEPPG